jgi:hypothetical protein
MGNDEKHTNMKDEAKNDEAINKNLPKGNIEKGNVLENISINLTSLDDNLDSLAGVTSDCYIKVQEIENKLNSKIYPLTENKKTEVIREYVEKEKPLILYGFGIVITLLSLAFGYYFLNENIDLKKENELLKASDIKYRYLKAKGDKISDLSNYVETSTDLVYLIDAKYKEDPQGIGKYTIEKEEVIKKAFEAKEIANQKEIEAREAQENAKKLQNKVNQIK